MRFNRIWLAPLVVFVGLLAKPASADPCGMVPPITPGQQVPLARIGLQQTYVFYKDGVETFVIRPGFTGKVDEFGMLIPFPTPPAIRKVPDHVFEHIAAAVDPPEVVVDLRIRLERLSALGGVGNRNGAAKNFAMNYREEEVRVIKEEAIGMYEVAVLEAGSAAALNRWMDEHGYRYPDGMDVPCNDYVKLGWCFVAVKTKVGQKKGVDPQPGQRAVTPKLPQGSTFDGHVQGMGFRFEADELVVPMRLSAFNAGELRNIVYLLTDSPQKIRAIPEEYVMRQIAGDQLIKNLTDPLPLRIIGGTEKEIPEYRRATLVAERNPVPHNGAAADLFASDLLAVKSGELALPHEEREKELLRIGERFGLRGPDIDKLNADSLSAVRSETVKQSLGQLSGMTLTVVDGDFPREVLAKQNLTFGEYNMPAKRNKAEAYDAKLNAPAPKKEGVLKLGALTPVSSPRNDPADSTEQVAKSPLVWPAIAALVGLAALLVVRRKHSRMFCVALGLTILHSNALRADEIHNAVQNGDLAAIERILKDDAKAIDAKQENGWTPLHLAIQRNRKDVIDLLLKNKPKIDIKDKNGYTPLHFAVMNYNQPIVKTLLEKGADIAVEDNQKQTPLHYAIQNRYYGAPDIIGLLLTGVKDVGAKLPGGQLPLHFAAEQGHHDAVQALLKRKADPNAKDDNGHTPLQLALRGNHQQAAGELIPVTDVRDFKTIDGQSLLHWAAANGLADAVKSLLKRGANVNATNADGETPLHSAAWNGHYQVVGLLLDAKADPNTLDASEKTPLYGAAWNGHLETVTTLVKGGAKVKRSDESYTPLHAAAWQGHDAVAAALLDFGADPNAKDSDGSTPLHKAAWRGHEKVAQQLLAHKAQADLEDSAGLTPLDMAKSASRDAVVALLSHKE